MSLKWRIGGVAVGILALAVIVTAAALRASIRSSLDEITGAALAAAPGSGDRVDALLVYVMDERRPIAERNRGVWALGQLRDPRALPILDALQVEECRHGEDICQHELQKAIALCSGEGQDLLRIAPRTSDGR